MTANRPRLPHRHLLVAALFVAPLALGSFDPLAIAVVCGLLGLSAALLAVEGSDRGVRLGVPGLLLGGMLAYTALQLLPLPASLVGSMWPGGNAVWQGALELAGSPGAARPLSLEPAATALEAAELGALLACLALSGLWVRESGHRPLLTTLALVGLACAAIALVHRLAGLERVYDLYEPLQVHATPVPAPLLNTNHLAGLLALTAPVAVGLGLEEEDRSRRALWLVAGGVIGMACVLTLSRGGIAALAAGAGLLVLLVALRRRSSEEPTKKGGASRRWAWLVAGAAATLGGGFYVAREAVIAEYAGGSNAKVAIWAAAWPLVEGMMPFGAGRGAFGAVFPAYSDLGAGSTYTHAENLLVQLAADQGLVGAAAGLLVVLGLVGLALRGTRRPAVAGAVAGSVALAAQNMVDFSVELLGVSLLLVAAVAAAVAGRRHQAGKQRSVRLPARPALAGLAALAALSATTAVWARGRTLEADDAALRERASAEEAPRFDRGLADAAVARHPADYLVPYLAGVWAFRSEGASPLPWLGWAQERSPSFGLAHLWTARAMVESGRPGQAMVEYREAAARDPRLVGPVAREAVGRFRTFEAVERLVAVEPPPLALWDALSNELVRAGRPEEAAASDAALLEAAPEHGPALERVARAAISGGEVERARELAGRLPASTAEAAVLRADVEARAGDHAAAVAGLEEALERSPADRTLLAALASHREAAGDRDGARRALALLEAASPRSALAGVLMAQASLEERADRQAEALHLYQRAAGLGGGRPAHLGVARVAERRGELVRALEALRRAAETGQADEALDARTRELQRQVERARLEGLVGSE